MGRWWTWSFVSFFKVVRGQLVYLVLGGERADGGPGGGEEDDAGVEHRGRSIHPRNPLAGVKFSI